MTWGKRRKQNSTMGEWSRERKRTDRDVEWMEWMDGCTGVRWKKE
jgi:hypothetical protein